MKKLLVIVAILLVAVLMVMTRPEKDAHKEAMMKAVKEFVDEEADERGFGDNVLTSLGKNIVNKTVETALNAKLKMDDYYLFNTTHVRLKGKDQLLSVGLLGQVITFDKKMLREKLEEAMQSKEEAANEKEAAKQSRQDLSELKKQVRAEAESVKHAADEALDLHDVEKEIRRGRRRAEAAHDDVVRQMKKDVEAETKELKKLMEKEEG